MYVHVNLRLKIGAITRSTVLTKIIVKPTFFSITLFKSYNALRHFNPTPTFHRHFFKPPPSLKGNVVVINCERSLI